MPDKKNKCPIANHKTWVSYIKDGKIQYIITSKTNNRDFYYLYKVNGDEYTKITKAKSPLDLEKHMKRGEKDG